MNPAGRLKAVIYLRVSTKEQAQKGGEAEGYSIPAQRTACFRKADLLNADVVAEYVDAGESAKTSARPDLQRMLAELSATPVDFVIVHKVDRLARNRVDDVEINVAIKKTGARLVSVMENIDETPSGHLMHGIMSSIAEFYSQNLATEVTKGMIQKLRSGGTVSKVPVGYCNITHFIDGKAIKTVELDTKRAPLIQEAFELYATGRYSLNTLADIFEAKGLTYSPGASKSGGPISPSHWGRLFNKRYYVGKVVWQGVEYQGKHTPLVSEELFNKVQEVMKAHVNSGERSYRNTHYLKGSLACARCEGRITYSVSTKKGVKKPYFFCLHRHERRTQCTLPYIRPDLIEDEIERQYREEIPINPEVMLELKEQLMQDLTIYGCRSDKERTALKNKIKALNEERYKWADKAMSGAVPDDIAKEKQTSLAKQIASAEQELKSYEISIQDARLNINKICDMAMNCGRLYADGSDATRQMLNQTLFERFEIDIPVAPGRVKTSVVYTRLKPAFAALKTATFDKALLKEEKRRDNFGVYSCLNSSRVSTLVIPRRIELRLLG